jgi:integrating conjugative element protein (TIGR03761 family)
MKATGLAIDQLHSFPTQGEPMPTPDATSSPTAPAQLASPTATLLGPLADETPDIMTLHTQDAFRMFTGRSADSQTNAPAIPGGRRFAAILKSIWYLSANDNPYADWSLIRVHQALVSLREQMAREAVECEAEFEGLRRKGLSLSMLSSRSPTSVALGFRSPYGYATAEAIVAFDHHVRMVKTLVLKDRLSDHEGRVAIREIGRGLRALFLEPIRWERLLLREEMLPLSRSDFLPGANDLARQRVQMAVTLLGEVPRTVFTGDDAPRHSQRRITPTAAELQLLRQASLNLDAQPGLAAPPAGQLL